MTTEYLRMPMEREVEVRFLSTTFEVHIFHYLHTGKTKWEQKEHEGARCPHCLEGVHLTQRYVTIVRDVVSGTDKIMSMPRALYLIVRAASKGERLTTGTYIVQRQMPPGTYDFRKKKS